MQSAHHSALASHANMIFVSAKQQPFRCGLCGTFFCINRELVLHVQIHLVNKPYQCGFCNSSYDSNPDLLVHVQSHRLFVCAANGSLQATCLANITQPKDRSEIGQNRSEISKDSSLFGQNRSEVSGHKHMVKQQKSTYVLRKKCVTVSSEFVDDDEAGGHRAVLKNNAETESLHNSLLTANTVNNEMDRDELQGPAAGTVYRSCRESACNVSAVSVKDIRMMCQPGSVSRMITCNQGSRMEENLVRDKSVTGIQSDDSYQKTGKVLTEGRSEGEQLSTYSDADTAGDYGGDKSKLRSSLVVAEERYADQLTYVGSNPGQSLCHQGQKTLNTKASKIQASNMCKCGVCGEIFPSTEAVTQHWMMCHGACFVCKERFSDPIDLQCHLSVHSELKSQGKYRPFVCAICGRDYLVIKVFQAHLQRHHHITAISKEQIATAGDNKIFTISTSNCTGSTLNLLSKDNALAGSNVSLLKSVTKTIEQQNWGLTTNAATSEMGDGDGDQPQTAAVLPVKMEILNSKAQSSPGEPLCQQSLPAYKPKVGTENNNTCKCGDCDAVFASILALTQHWEVCHGNCFVCEKRFSDPVDFQCHLTLHSAVKSRGKDRSFLCNICGTDYLVVRLFHAHLQRCHQIRDNSWIENIASLPKPKQKKQSLESVSLTEQNAKPHHCTHCNRRYKSKYHLGFHIDTAHPEMGKRLHRCKECGEKFHSRFMLRDHHKSSHSKKEVRPHQCAGCGRTFNVQVALKVHANSCKSFNLQAGDGSEEMTWSKLAAATGHQKPSMTRKHKKKNKNLCHICGKVVVDLQCHLTGVHNELRPFKCAICDKAFKFYKVMQIHMMIHTKQKPFVCEVCGMSFTIKATLQYHLNTHSNAKPYACKTCNARFNYPSILREHMRRHAGDCKMKHFVCNICGKVLLSQDGIKRHYLTHTNQRPWSCEICGKKYRDKAMLKQHRVRIHNTKGENQRQQAISS